MKNFIREVFRVARHIGIVEQIFRLFVGTKEGGGGVEKGD